MFIICTEKEKEKEDFELLIKDYIKLSTENDCVLPDGDCNDCLLCCEYNKIGKRIGFKLVNEAIK